MQFGKIGLRYFEFGFLVFKFLFEVLKFAPEGIILMFLGRNFLDQLHLFLLQLCDLALVVLVQFLYGIFKLLNLVHVILLLPRQLVLVFALRALQVLLQLQYVFGELVDADAFLQQFLRELADFSFHEGVVFFAVR